MVLTQKPKPEFSLSSSLPAPQQLAPIPRPPVAVCSASQMTLAKRKSTAAISRMPAPQAMATFAARPRASYPQQKSNPQNINTVAIPVLSPFVQRSLHQTKSTANVSKMPTPKVMPRPGISPSVTCLQNGIELRKSVVGKKSATDLGAVCKVPGSKTAPPLRRR